jgi:hypothetical protein
MTSPSEKRAPRTVAENRKYYGKVHLTWGRATRHVVEHPYTVCSKEVVAGMRVRPVSEAVLIEEAGSLCRRCVEAWRTERRSVAGELARERKSQ